MKKLLIITYLLALLFFTPNNTLAANAQTNNLIKTDSGSAVYWIQKDGSRLVFPSDKIYNNHFENFDNIKIVSPEELQKHLFKGNVKLKNNTLVNFGPSPKIYQIKNQNELEWIKSEKGFEILNFKYEDVINLPEIYFTDYSTREKNGSYNEVLDQIKLRFIDQTRASEIDDIASSSEGLVEALDDEYAEYWSKEEFDNFTSMLNNDSFEGIGAQIEIQNEQLQVVTPLKGSPAESAGIKAGDKIMYIDDLDTAGIDINKAVMVIRGPKSTNVVLKIAREGYDNLLPITITRGTIVMKHFLSNTKTTPENKRIGYLSITQFSQTASQDLKKSSKNILAQNYDGMILDLRNNPGGYLSVATTISSNWLQSKDVILKERRANTEITHIASGDNIFSGIPLVILVNKGSASASEILAGALQDHGVGTIIGTQTFGKGVVQEIVPLTNGNVIKLTVSEWFTPNNNKINKKGITPDIVVIQEKEGDTQLEKALEELDIIINNRLLRKLGASQNY